MAGNASRHARRITWRSALPSFATSALLFIAALNPASLAAATPQAAAPKDVARKDTLIVSGFGPGLTEIQDPTEHEPLLARRVGPCPRHPEQDDLRIPLPVQPQHGRRDPVARDQLHGRPRREKRRRHPAQRYRVVRWPTLHRRRRQIHPRAAARQPGPRLRGRHQGVGQGRRRHRCPPTSPST